MNKYFYNSEVFESEKEIKDFIKYLNENKDYALKCLNSIDEGGFTFFASDGGITFCKNEGVMGYSNFLKGKKYYEVRSISTEIKPNHSYIDTLYSQLRRIFNIDKNNLNNFYDR